MLQSTGSRRVGHDLATEQKQAVATGGKAFSRLCLPTAARYGL